MGASGQTLDLLKVGAKSANAGEVRDAIRGVVTKTWRAALSKAHAKEACQWIDFGADSLLMVAGNESDDPGDDAGEPTDAVTFWFYETVEWPQALAEHWLAHALVANRNELDQALKRLGYAIAKDSWYPTKADLPAQRFIVDKKRIGRPDDEGVFWQLPEYDYTVYEGLDAKTKKTALAIKEGAACQCPYCVRPKP
jgi:hypothetical protein